MANTILTPKMITKESLRILHNNIAFVGSIRRDFDASFANAGAKIGSTLRIRKPAMYTLRNGQALNVQSYVQTEGTLTLTNQLGIDVEMSSSELTLDLNDFAEQVLKGQIARLAAGIEELALNQTVNKVGNFKLVGTVGTSIGFADINGASVGLDKLTTPRDGNRTFLVSPDHQAGYMDATKGLFNPSANIGKQYTSGDLSDAFGFVAKSSNLIPNYPILPSASGVVDTATIAPTAITLGGAGVDGGFTTATLTFAATTGASVIKAGSIFIAGTATGNGTVASPYTAYVPSAFLVNPETKKFTQTHMVLLLLLTLLLLLVLLLL